MDQWIELRRQIRNGEVSLRQLHRETGISRPTLRKIRDHSEPPGYRRSKPVEKSKIGPYLGRIKQTTKEVFMPLSQRPGEAQVDFGHALANFNGTLKKVVFFVMTMVHSDAMFVMAFPRECTELWGHGKPEMIYS